jgi:hypothetical protein
MTALECYKKYRIYRGLQLHQLRVAAVARTIALTSKEPLDPEAITRIMLVHDMGNIIKADLVHFQEFLEPEGLEYWQAVKGEFRERYGDDEHVATNAICRELGFSDSELAIIDNLRFSRTRWILESGSLEQKICKYADLRVSPWGIVPMLARLAEARERYGARPMDAGEQYTGDDVEKGIALCIALEENLIQRCDFKPEDLTDASLAALVEELKTYPVA